MEFRTTKIVWKDDRAVAKLGDFIIDLKRKNDQLVEAKVTEVLSYTSSNVQIPYVTNVEKNYIAVNMGFCGVKKFELVEENLKELY